MAALSKRHAKHSENPVVLMGDGVFISLHPHPRLVFTMKFLRIGVFCSAWIPSLALAQVTPAHPDRFMNRTNGGSSGGVEVIPRDAGKPKTVRYVTYIVLSTSRLWTSPDGKNIEGKLIAFEDMVIEAPKGAAAPPNPTPPESPTVVRDEKIRLLVKDKPIVVALSRFSAGDVEFVEQVRKAYTKKPTTKP